MKDFNSVLSMELLIHIIPPSQETLLMPPSLVGLNNMSMVRMIGSPMLSLYDEASIEIVAHMNIVNDELSYGNKSWSWRIAC